MAVRAAVAGRRTALRLPTALALPASASAPWPASCRARRQQGTRRCFVAPCCALRRRPSSSHLHSTRARAPSIRAARARCTRPGAALRAPTGPTQESELICSVARAPQGAGREERAGRWHSERTEQIVRPRAPHPPVGRCAEQLQIGLEEFDAVELLLVRSLFALLLLLRVELEAEAAKAPNSPSRTASLAVSVRARARTQTDRLHKFFAQIC